MKGNEAAAEPHDAKVKGQDALITRTADFRPKAGQKVPGVKIAKHQGDEKTEVSEDARTIQHEIDKVKRDLTSRHHDEEDTPRLRKKLAALQVALAATNREDEGRSKFGGAVLDEVRTRDARSRLAAVREGRVEELASVVNYLVRRATEDPSDTEARELAVASLLANHEPLTSHRLDALLAHEEAGIVSVLGMAHDADDAAGRLIGAGFERMGGGPTITTSYEANALTKLMPKMKNFEHGDWHLVKHGEKHGGHGEDEIDTTSGSHGSTPEETDIAVFRTPRGHVVRVMTVDLIAGEKFAAQLYYLSKGF